MKLKFGDGKNILLSDNHLLATDRKNLIIQSSPVIFPSTTQTLYNLRQSKQVKEEAFRISF